MKKNKLDRLKFDQEKFVLIFLSLNFCGIRFWNLFFREWFIKKIV